MNLKLSVFLIFSVFMSHFLVSQEFHVSKRGNDNNSGTKKSPFKTISKAAKIALPGSSITVHEGPIVSGLIQPLEVLMTTIVLYTKQLKAKKFG